MALTKTEHLGLSVFPQTEEDKILVRDILRAIAEDNDISNMKILDQTIYDLQNTDKTKVVWSGNRPDTQSNDDVWNEILNT